MKQSIRLFGQPPNGVHRVAKNIRMNLDMTQPIDRAVFFNAYEVLPVRVFLDHLKRGDTFVDIGGNIGYYSLLAKNRVGSSGQVIAFEPNPIMVQQLTENFELNCFDLEVHGVALADKPGILNLYVPNEHLGEASLERQEWNDCEPIAVPACRLDDVLNENKVNKVDFIKADIEGAELLAFQGAEATICKHRPTILFEINMGAAKCFGFGAYDAAKLLLDYVPEYKITRIDPHLCAPTTLDQLVDERVEKTNLLLTPSL